MKLSNYLNNRFTPNSSPYCIILKAVGCNFINGLSDEYDSNYPPELKGQVHPDDFKKVMKSINLALIDYWPCGGSQFIGFTFACMTFGCSLFCPYVCIKIAEGHVLKQIKEANECFFWDNDCEMRQVKKCGRTSYIQIFVGNNLEVGGSRNEFPSETIDIKKFDDQRSIVESDKSFKVNQENEYWSDFYNT